MFPAGCVNGYYVCPEYSHSPACKSRFGWLPSSGQLAGALPCRYTPPPHTCSAMALLRRLPRQLLRSSPLQSSCRGFAVAEQVDDGDPTITVTVNPYKLHRLEEGPSQEACSLHGYAYGLELPAGPRAASPTDAHVHSSPATAQQNAANLVHKGLLVSSSELRSTCAPHSRPGPGRWRPPRASCWACSS